MRKSIRTGIAALGLLAGTAQATGQAAPDASAPAAAAAPLTLDTPIEQIAANPKGKAVLDTYMARLMNSPAYEMVKAMSLRKLQPMSQGRVTQDTLDKVDAAFKAINAGQ